MNAHAKFDAVLFDLDGTLVDTAPDFIKVVNQQREAHKLGALAPATIEAQVSNGSRALIKLSFGLEEGDDNFDEYRQELLDLYLDVVGDAASLYEGMEQLLDTLEKHEIAWGIVTNKPRLYSEKLLDKLNLSDRCSVLVCPCDLNNAKPDPEGIQLAMEKLTASPSRTAYVGDHERDILAAKAAGELISIAVSYGYLESPKEAYTWEADHVVDHAEELIPLLTP